jgi:GNAT superfamily N-acetyltransferase
MNGLSFIGAGSIFIVLTPISSTMEIKVRKGVVEDITAIHALIVELAVFEKAGDEVSVTIDQLREDGFGESSRYQFLVAELHGEVVGMSLFYLKYSTWKGTCLFLEDLIVTSSKRQLGIGQLLFDGTVAEARKISAGRMEWQVLDWNEPAIKFYKKLNANLDGEWINCKLTHEQIMAYE